MTGWPRGIVGVTSIEGDSRAAGEAVPWGDVFDFEPFLPRCGSDLMILFSENFLRCFSGFEGESICSGRGLLLVSMSSSRDEESACASSSSLDWPSNLALK